MLKHTFNLGMFLTAGVALSNATAGPAGIQMMTNSPSVEVSSAERLLDSKDIAESPCTTKVRALASRYEGVIMESEQITYDSTYGYIYRYNVINRQVDDGSFHPDDETKDVVHEVKSKIVIHTIDCQALILEYHPFFELPARDGATFLRN